MKICWTLLLLHLFLILISQKLIHCEETTPTSSTVKEKYSSEGSNDPSLEIELSVRRTSSSKTNAPFTRWTKSHQSSEDGNKKFMSSTKAVGSTTSNWFRSSERYSRTPRRFSFKATTSKSTSLKHISTASPNTRTRYTKDLRLLNYSTEHPTALYEKDLDLYQCYNHDDCLWLKNSVCSYYRCQCLDSDVIVNNECIPSGDFINDPCNYTYQCKALNSECILNYLGHGTCQCKDGYLPESSIFAQECLEKANNINSACTKSVQCQTENSMCVMDIDFWVLRGSCQCVDGYVKSRSENACIKKGSENSCHYSRDCYWLENSFCFLTRCQCRVGYIEVADECLRQVTSIGSSCKRSEQCKISNSECLGGTCRCKSGYKPDSTFMANSCSKKRSENSCHYSRDCYWLENSFCFLTRCQCRVGYIEVADECLRQVTSIGSSCKRSEQCKISNSECLGGTCRCKSGYKPDSTFMANSCSKKHTPSTYGGTTIDMRFIYVPVIVFVVVTILVLIISYGFVSARRVNNTHNRRTVRAHRIENSYAWQTHQVSQGPRRCETSETLVDETDKPPSYEEVIATSRSTNNLSPQEPPSYQSTEPTAPRRTSY